MALFKALLCWIEVGYPELGRHFLWPIRFSSEDGERLVGGGWASLVFRVGSYRTLITPTIAASSTLLHIHILAPTPAARRPHIHHPLLARTRLPARPLSAHIHNHSTTHPHCTLRSLGAGS